MTGETVVLGQKLVPLSQCHLSSATNPHMDLQSYGVLMGCLNYWLLSAISEQKKKRNCSHSRPFIKVGLASSAMFVVEIKSAGTAVTGGPHVMIRERKLQVSPALTFWVACCPQRYTGLFSRTLNSNYNPTYSKKNPWTYVTSHTASHSRISSSWQQNYYYYQSVGKRPSTVTTCRRVGLCSCKHTLTNTH